MDDRILVFIPMYNCKKQIVRVLEQLDGDIGGYISEVVVINNRSTDGSENAAVRKIIDMKFPFKVCVLRNRENYGLGGSHKVAFRYAIKNAFDYCICLHGDDQGCINDLLPVLKSGDYRKKDCILGGRFVKGSKLEGYSKFRIFGNRIFNIIFSICLNRKIYDLGAGLNMYSAQMLRKKYYMKFPDDLTFNCYMLFAIIFYRFSYEFIPITWRETDQVSNVKIISQAFRTLKMAVGYKLYKQKYMLRDARIEKINNYKYDVIFTNMSSEEKK